MNASELTGKIADMQRKQLATYYIRSSVDQAAGFLRARHASPAQRRAWALEVLGYAAWNLADIGVTDRYVSTRQ